MGETYIHQVGDLKFLRKKDCGPGNMFTCTLFGIADDLSADLKQRWYTGVLRLPLKVDHFDPKLDDEAYRAYKQLAPMMTHALSASDKLLAGPDSFLSIMRGNFPFTKSNCADWENKDGKLELIINQETPVGDFERDHNALHKENYIEHLKKHKTWEKYFYNTKPGENSENWCIATTLGPLIPGLLTGFGIGHAAGGEVSSLIGGIGGLLGGACIGLGINYVSAKIRKALFYRNMIKYPIEYLNEIHFSINSKNAERAELETKAETSKIHLEQLSKSKNEVKERQLSINEYARTVAKLACETNEVQSTLTTLETAIKEKKSSIKSLYFAAGKIFDRETYKPGLIVRFTSESLKNVEDYFAPILDLTNRSLVVAEAQERADKIIAFVEENLEKVKKLEEAKATTKLAEGEKKVETLFGTYQLLEKIGSGGFGEVYLVKNDNGETLALKKPISKESEKYFREKPQKTIDTILQLEHPNIVKVQHIDAKGETPYEVSEYVEGGDLEAKLAKAKMPTQEVFKLLAGIAEGLAYAHSQELVHGDIKPRNILLTKEGNPKIADFDSAKALDEDAIKLSMSLTKSLGNVIITWDYSAPEVLKKQSAPTKQSDVYSFGALTFRILAGVTKNEANKSLKDYRKDLPDDVISMVQKCLEPNPQDRYQSMKEVVDVLEHDGAIRATASFLAGFFTDGPEPTEHDVKPVEKLSETHAGTIDVKLQETIDGLVVNKGKVPEKFKLDGLGTIPVKTEKRELQLEE